MLRVLSGAEVQCLEDRRAALFASAYIVDTLTAVLMDGLGERAARQAAHQILAHLGLPELGRVNRDWTPEGRAHAAIAAHVLREP